MFGWRTPSDRDAGAVARRRLAAIAAQFERADASPNGDQASRSDRSAGMSEFEPVEQAGSPATIADGSTGRGRHVTRSIEDQHSRSALSAHHVAIVAVAALAMVALAAWWVLRSVPHSQPVPISSERTLPSSDPAVAPPVPSSADAPTPLSTSGGPPGGQPGSTTPAAGQVVVDVAGKVRRPGIVELPAGSRVADALDAAGGVRPGVHTGSLDLARLLVDGEQVVVGFRVPALGVPPGVGTPSTRPSSAAVAPVDLNTATAEQLDTLPGIGPVTAQAILTWRGENGAFTSVDELLEVSGIGDATLDDIAPYVYV